MKNYDYAMNLINDSPTNVSTREVQIAEVRALLAIADGLNEILFQMLPKSQKALTFMEKVTNDGE